MAHRRVNGEGTNYRRKDGRHEAAKIVITVSGARKRLRVYGKTAQEAYGKLAALEAQVQQGVPFPDKEWKLGEYLDYWLENYVKADKRPKTYEQYAMSARLYIKPGLGARALSDLTVPMVQAFLNGLLKDGRYIRTVQIARTTLSAALTRAQREELVNRNVARLVELPQYVPKEVKPWSLEEARKFFGAAADDRLSAAFTLLLFYGLRCGEVLGLRWCDIDREKGVIHIRQQLQRVAGRGLLIGPVKTNSGKRDLPIVRQVAGSLEEYQHQQTALRGRQPSWAGSGDDQELVFTTSVGTPIEPRNFVRTFWKICNENDLRVIKLHHLRHTTATLLKDLGVPARDAQLILGHASSWMTEQIYQHADMDSRKNALEKVESVFARAFEVGGDHCRQIAVKPSVITNWLPFMQPHPIYKIGGPGGTRTLDILLKRHEKPHPEHRLQSVRAMMEVRTRELLVGCVAVNLAVKPTPSPQAVLGRTSLSGNGLARDAELQEASL
jgi:integrase